MLGCGAARDFAGCIEGYRGCAGCHSGENAPFGLRLDDARALAETAIGRVARETDIGGTVGATLEDPPRFGAKMPVVDPGRPDNSYLIYKILAGPSAYAANTFESECPTAYAVSAGSATDPTCLVPSAGELLRLRQWLVPGDPMPPPGTMPFPRSTHVRGLSAWIRAGAACP
jgi:hypothetical protein